MGKGRKGGKGKGQVQRLRDLLPLGVAGEGDEEVRLAALSDDGHGVLAQALHVPGAARERSGEDDLRDTDVPPDCMACVGGMPD
jgi:hypothetical protein